MEPKIIFEDEFLAVIDKPAGMVANDSLSTTDITVQKWFTDKFQIPTSNNQGEFYEKGGIVHRLDKDTSGVMVLAKTPAAYEKLKQQFLERKTLKKYTALIHETFTDKHGEISQPIERHAKDRKRFGIGRDLSRMAITEWSVVGEYTRGEEKFSLMELVPHTGRTHQLRVHMQYMHHPIVSDPIYGYKKRWQEDLLWCPRLFLHAKYLEIEHPGTGKRIYFETTLAPELQSALEKLVKVDMVTPAV
jgi:23S rRNA pseudouridine1911/1915/1917 synthase